MLSSSTLPAGATRWVRGWLTFENVNRGPLEKVELAKVKTSGIACSPCTPTHALGHPSEGFDGWFAPASMCGSLNAFGAAWLLRSTHRLSE